MVTEFRYPAKITYGISNYEQLRNLIGNVRTRAGGRLCRQP